MNNAKHTQVFYPAIYQGASTAPYVATIYIIRRDNEKSGPYTHVDELTTSWDAVKPPNLFEFRLAVANRLRSWLRTQPIDFFSPNNMDLDSYIDDVCSSLFMQAKLGRSVNVLVTVDGQFGSVSAQVN